MSADLPAEERPNAVRLVAELTLEEYELVLRYVDWIEGEYSAPPRDLAIRASPLLRRILRMGNNWREDWRAAIEHRRSG